MSTTSIRALLEKQARNTDHVAGSLPAESESGEQYRAFANGRIGVQPQLTLLFRTAAGLVRGFSYSYFFGIESDDPSTGFVVDFTHEKVVVAGRNLQQLFHLVCAHRVAEIVEVSRTIALEADQNEAVVEQISLKRR